MDEGYGLNSAAAKNGTEFLSALSPGIVAQSVLIARLRGAFEMPESRGCLSNQSRSV